MMRGKLTFQVLQLHERYGTAVRIAPDELAFTHPDAWKDIYGHRVGRNQSVEELPKAGKFYRTHGTLPNIISEESRDNHTLIRRLVSHGFSDQRLREQEPIIVGYADKLISQLRKHCGGPADPKLGYRPPSRPRLNMTAWYNYVTVDIITDLTFGEPSGCVDNGAFDPWIKAINGTIENFLPLQALKYLGIEWPFNWFTQTFFNRNRFMNRKVVAEKIQRRLSLTVSRPDFVEDILRRKEEWNIPYDVILGNAVALCIAGSETTATLLAGMTWILCKHPSALAKLKEEIRGKFKDDSEITLTTVLELPWLLACLDEAMRFYPPVPIGLLRTVPDGGVTIAGHAVPGGTDVAIWQWAMNHYSKHWEQPMEYHPERFLREDSPLFAGDVKYVHKARYDEEEFAGDRLDLLQPFVIGPRNCLGRNLAYAEMRLILARMVFHFDFELADPDIDWIGSQRANFLWTKGPLDIYLTPVRT